MRFKCLILVFGLGFLFGPMAGVGESRSSSGDSSQRASKLRESWKDFAAQTRQPHRIDTRLAQQGQAGRTFVINAGNGNAQAEEAFRKLDANGDGLLDYNEMDEGLRAERGKWDTDQNGFIDLAEFKEYFRAHRRQNREAVTAQVFHQLLTQEASRALQMQLAGQPMVVNNNMQAQPADAALLDLPPNLPPWFTQYDFDHDGQIGLYEWKRAGQPIERFLEYDHNGDGFITPDEALEGPAKR